MEAFGYCDGDVDLTAQVHRPNGAARAAVAVFPTIMNPTPAVSAKAQALADAGYLAVVCDFYGKVPGTLEQSFGWANTLRNSPAAFRARLHAGIEATRTISGDMPMCAIGFCMGGQAVLELARDGADLAAVASFHGLLDTGSKAHKPIAPRILLCHGDADTLVPRAQVIAFWEEMDAVDADWHFHSYSGVAHGFTNPRLFDGSDNPAYNASADRQSWFSLLSFLDETLG